VPYLAAEILGLNPVKDTLTLTGGLPFFGGAGNNYSTHAIASMVERLRAKPDDYGLVVANGGFISKQSAGVYSAQPPAAWRAYDPENAKALIAQQEPVTLLQDDGDAVITGYAIRHSKSGVDHCYLAAENAKGRYLAKVNSEHKATLTAMSKVDELLGKKVQIRSIDGENTIVNKNQLGVTKRQDSGAMMSELKLTNSYKHIQLEVNGNVLEVALNRPESYNALFSEAHFELAEIFDAFEADKDLWVAIITGSGDKAFCSGNDLKVTAKGGDMSLPKSGFAGLSSRMNREKPVIAAVNGLAFGGGMEIVLAADMAVAVPHAKFALPEVKVGLFAGAGGVQRLSKQIGRKAAMELILTGRAISAQEALQYGIINAVTDDMSALDHARQIAVTITANSPSAIRASKRVLNEIDRIDDVAETLKLSGPEFKKLLQTKDAREGVTAFAEKRKPTWLNE
jgi:acetyl-CoA C-acetyltransferase